MTIKKSNNDEKSLQIQISPGTHPSAKIHRLAIVSPGVEIGADVEVGPFSIINTGVKIGRGTKIESHASIGNPTGLIEIGEDNHISAGAVVGGPPQDISYKGEVTQLSVGHRNLIREFTTINCGTIKGGGITRVGSNCMIMAYVHVAHDCRIGDSVIVANSTQFAGHVEVGDHARVSGMVGISQFVRIGRYAYIGGAASVNKDVPPYSVAEGHFARMRAANKIGITRAGFSKEDVDSIYKAVRFLIMGDRTVDEALVKIKNECKPSEHIEHFINFIKSSEIGVAR